MSSVTTPEPITLPATRFPRLRPAYARGYRVGAVRTLMAYFVTGSANARILNYSSSTVLEAGAATGNVSQDNARRLREMVATLAAYRAAVGGGTLPAAPTGLAANVVGPNVTVSWAAVATATAYVLDVGTAPGDSSLGSFTVPGTSAAGAVPPGTYYWRVRAQNSAGTGPPSAESTFVVAGATPPGPPTSFVASAVSTTVTLSWLAPTTGGAVTGYELGVGFTPGASDLIIPLSTSPVAFAGVAPGTYYLRLKSVGPGGQSPPTPEVPLTVSSACTPPGHSDHHRGRDGWHGLARMDDADGNGAVHLQPRRRVCSGTG